MVAEVADALAAAEATDTLCRLSTSSTALTDPQLFGGETHTDTIAAKLALPKNWFLVFAPPKRRVPAGGNFHPT